MNVCLISREFPPFFGGGIGTYNVQWSRALSAAGHRVVVVTVSDDGTTRRATSGGVTVVRLPFLRGADWSAPHPSIGTPEVVAAFRSLAPVSAFAMQVERAIPDLAREFQLDIIEVPDTGALAWFGLNNRRTGGSWRDGPPIVTTIHSPSAWIAHYNRQPLTSRAELVLASMERDSALWSDALISPSSALADWTLKNWDLSRDVIDIIPYPLGDLECAATRLSRTPVTPRGSDGAFRILFIGRLEPRKGIDTLLESVARTNGLELLVDLVGEDTPDPGRPGLFGQNSLQALVPESRRGQVRLLGRKSPADLTALRDNADAVVIPSPMDNFPYVCVEAMAEGRLVIASSKGGTAEMIRDGVDGLLFDAGDPLACATILFKAASQAPAARLRMRHSAATRILDYCGNDSILARRLAHYTRTIDRARARQVRINDEPLAVVNRAATPAPSVNRLSGALRTAGVEFAHGWPRTEFEVHAFSTPTVRSLGMAPRALGPLVVSLAAVERAAVGDLLQPTSGEPGEFRTDSTWVLALALSAAGCRGVAVPDVIVDIAPAELHPLDRAIVHELDAIHASRAWRFVNRIYDLLHVLRGRGLRRPYHPRGPRRPRQV